MPLFNISRPEEAVRGKLVHHLTEDLGFSKELISIEKSLSELPHLSDGASFPDRRVDLLCYYKKEDKLLPLLLIECKAKRLDKKALFQLQGYNHFIKAPYLGLVAEGQILFSSAFDLEKTFSFIPKYSELVGSLS